MTVPAVPGTRSTPSDLSNGKVEHFWRSTHDRHRSDLQCSSVPVGAPYGGLLMEQSPAGPWNTNQVQPERAEQGDARAGPLQPRPPRWAPPSLPYPHQNGTPP
jgi:hypothetical protein